MCLHSRLYLMIYRPHRQHVLELTKPPFDVAQVLVDRHHLEYAQTQLAGRDYIFTFDPLLAPQACRVLEVPEAPLVELPGIVAVAMAPLQQPLGRGADLLGLLQLAGRYPMFGVRQRNPLADKTRFSGLSLHHGFLPLGGCRRLQIRQLQCLQDPARVRAASTDPATFRSIVHAKRHQAYRLERLHRPLRREVDPRLLKPAIQEPLHQEHRVATKICAFTRASI